METRSERRARLRQPQPSMPSRPRRVKAAFIWPFALVLAFILSAFVTAAYFQQVQVRDRALADRMSAVSRLLEQKLGKDTNLMEAVLRTLMQNREVQAALADRDRESLLRKVGPLFQTLRTDHRITHLYFNGPDLVNILRLHSPGEFGDLINRETMNKARVSGRVAQGLELGPLGTLTLRLVVPWRAPERLLGYLEIGEEIGDLVEEIHETLSVDLFVLVDKGVMLPEQWQHGMALFKREGSWDRFGSRVLIAQTAAQAPASLDDRILARLSSGGSEVLRDGDRIVHLAMLPLDDASGRRLGDFVLVRDITALQGAFMKSIMTVTLLSMLVGVGVLSLFYFALDRVERDYRRQYELEHQLLRMGTEYQRMLQIEKLSALGTMVGEIAHQLNNPLVGVVNLAQLAQREADDPTQTRDLLKEIERAGADCHSFIESMLRFAKVSNFESRATDMTQVVEEAVLLFRQTERRRLPVQTSLPDPAVVLAVDPILIRHALFNLLTNAAQATPGEGAIIIGLEPGAHAHTGAPGWILSVTDHGVGVAPDILDKIFLPFFTTRVEGTGLGLPVVQHVALVHGGYVSATVRPEGGTQFAVWLPQTPVLAQTNHANPSKPVA